MTIDPGCREPRKLMTAYLDGVLPSTTVVRLEAHVARCEACQSHLEELRQSLVVTGSLSADDIDDAMMRRLRSAFRHWPPSSEATD